MLRVTNAILNYPMQNKYGEYLMQVITGVIFKLLTKNCFTHGGLLDSNLGQKVSTTLGAIKIC
jgi:hypothetical protein